MNWIVGDRAIVKKRGLRGPERSYLVKITSIDSCTTHTVEYISVLNANTGKKYTTKGVAFINELRSLEDFLDQKRLLIKELEQYL